MKLIIEILEKIQEPLLIIIIKIVNTYSEYILMNLIDIQFNMISEGWYACLEEEQQ